MPSEKKPNPGKWFRSTKGFTLMETLFAAALLAMMGVAVSALYVSGSISLNENTDLILLDSHLRSRMEFLVSTDFDALTDGSQAVTINGQNYTVIWKVQGIDLDADTFQESDARQVTVYINELPERSLNTLIVDTKDKVEKIS